jgi:putative ABC transport system permease protein
MKIREDIKMGLRWVIARPVETLLLVFGISLGIGATAAGIALAGRTAAETHALLSETQYREIVVTAQESSSDMDVPAEERSVSDTIILTTSDLAAREEAEDVQYAYVANRMDLRLGTSQEPGEGAPPDVAPTGTAAAVSSAETAVTTDGPQPVLDEIAGYQVTPEYFTAWSLFAAEGSLFTTQDMADGKAYLVLGSKLAATLFEDGESLGRDIVSRGTLYTIVGILEPTGTDADGMAFAPAVMAELTGRDAMARMFQRFDTSLHFTVADSSRLEQARAELATWFETQYGAGSVVITVPRAAAEAARDRNARLVTVILFLALSALVIAAANVTNILFARALRKRRSVGVLKALGAASGEVFRLFFLEALIIGAAGAALGTGLSILFSTLMQKTMGFGGASLGLLGAGIVGAVGLVTVLDTLPAMQAARAPAAEAIRYE